MEDPGRDGQNAHPKLKEEKRNPLKRKHENKSSSDK